MAKAKPAVVEAVKVKKEHKEKVVHAEHDKSAQLLSMNYFNAKLQRKAAMQSALKKSED